MGNVRKSVKKDELLIHVRYCFNVLTSVLTLIIYNVWPRCRGVKYIYIYIYLRVYVDDQEEDIMTGNTNKHRKTQISNVPS